MKPSLSTSYNLNAPVIMVKLKKLINYFFKTNLVLNFIKTAILQLYSLKGIKRKLDKIN